MFSLVCAQMNGWVNNGEAGYLRYHRAHYDVIVILWWSRNIFHVITSGIITNINVPQSLGFIFVYHIFLFNLKSMYSQFQLELFDFSKPVIVSSSSLSFYTESWMSGISVWLGFPQIRLMPYTEADILTPARQCFRQETFVMIMQSCLNSFHIPFEHIDTLSPSQN